MFSRPWLLLLLALPILQLCWVWQRRSGRFAMPFDTDGARRLGSGVVVRGLLGLAESLPALLLAVAVLLLALPQELAAPKQRRALTNIQFLVDISGSMTAQFGKGSRYDASMQAINDFLDYRAGDSFGLTFFGNQYLHWVPLTSDPSAFRNAIPFMRPENAPPGFGGTEIGRGDLRAREAPHRRAGRGRMPKHVHEG